MTDQPPSAPAMDLDAIRQSLRKMGLPHFVEVIDAEVERLSAAPHAPTERCRQCGQARVQHCDLDEPGVDHPDDCDKMHHEFKVAAPVSPPPTEPQIELIRKLRREIGNVIYIIGRVHRDLTQEEKAQNVMLRDWEKQLDAIEAAAVSPPTPRLVEQLRQLPRYAFDQYGTIYGPVDPDENSFIRNEDFEAVLVRTWDAPRTFQQRVDAWMRETFDEATRTGCAERNYRFVEEAIELVQSLGATRDEVLLLLDYVYGRPAGEPTQEVGGVMVTLAALCTAAAVDLDAAAEAELKRVWQNIERIRAKHQAKPYRSPLPGEVRAGDAPSEEPKP